MNEHGLKVHVKGREMSQYVLQHDILGPETRHDSPVKVLCYDLDSAFAFAIPKTDLLEIPYVCLRRPNVRRLGLLCGGLHGYVLDL